MNKKGFTLVELLLVIVIIAIVAAITLPNIFNMLNSSKDKKYDEYQNIVVENLKIYNSDYKVDLWENSSLTKVRIESDELKEVNQNIDIGECSISYLGIGRDEDKYEYLVCLDCDGEKYGNGCDEALQEERFSDFSCGEITGASTTWTKNDRTVSVACRGNDCSKASVSKTFDTSTRTGKIVISDKFGNTKTCNVNVYVDKVKPTCGVVTGASTTWTKNDRAISIGCTDSYGECSTASVSKTFNTNMKTGIITISDKAGNIKDCNVNVYVDKTPPTCGVVTGASTTWTKNDRAISVGCTDAYGECSTASVSKTFDTSTKVGVITISDTVGNTTDCNVNAYVDKTPPTCGVITGASTTWTKNDRTISIGCTDSYGECSTASVSKTFNTNTQTGIITISDTVGNTKDCNVNAYVDKTPPTCGVITGASTTWTKNDRTISIGCTDAYGQCSTASVSKTFNTNTQVGTITISDKATNSINCNVNAYVDKTPPTCGTITGASTTWTNANRNISVACTDTFGQCDVASYSNNFTTNTQVGTITISDKATNTTTCNVNAYVDKTDPSCSVQISGKIGLRDWYVEDVKITVSGSDSLSKVDKYYLDLVNPPTTERDTYTHTSATASATAYGKVTDLAGNFASCNKTFKRDVYPSITISLSACSTGTSTATSQSGLQTVRSEWRYACPSLSSSNVYGLASGTGTGVLAFETSVKNCSSATSCSRVSYCTQGNGCMPNPSNPIYPNHLACTVNLAGLMRCSCKNCNTNSLTTGTSSY